MKNKNQIIGDIVKKMLSYKTYIPYLFSEHLICIDIINNIIMDKKIVFNEFIKTEYFEKQFNKASNEHEWALHRYKVVEEMREYRNKLISIMKTNCSNNIIENCNDRYSERMEELDGEYSTGKRGVV
jgi:hypothetical protein